MIICLFACKFFTKYVTQSVCLFVNFQHNSKTTAQIVLKFSRSIGTVTNKNCIKCGHDRVKIFDLGVIFLVKLSALAPMGPNVSMGKMRSFS